MSLRARLLAGMAVIALVLTFAALLIVRITERDLVAQVDAQLVRTLEREFDRRPPGGLEQRLSSYYVGYMLPGGTVSAEIVPATTDAVPELDAGDADRAARRPITTSSS